MTRSIISCALFAGVALASARVGLVDKRQSCPYGEGYFPECGQCCNMLGLAGCYAPAEGPNQDDWACYDSPPGIIVSTVYHSSGAYFSSMGYYGSLGGSSSYAPSYPTASSSNPYYGDSSSSANGYGYGSSSSANGYGYGSSSAANPGYTPGPAPPLPSPSTTFGLSGPSGSATPSQIAGGGASEVAGNAAWIWRFVAGAVGVAFWL